MPPSIPVPGVPAYVPAKYRPLIAQAAAATGLPASVVAAQIDTESVHFDPYYVYGPGTSPAGAEGIAQFEPGTWRSYGSGSPFSPQDAMAAYAKYMNALLRRYGGDIRSALAAYNAGPGNISAGMSYANSILSRAGVPVTQHAGHAAGAGSSSSGGGLLGQVLGLPSQVTDFLTALEKPVQGMMWFVDPDNWARIIAGGIGLVFLAAGLIALGLAA